MKRGRERLRTRSRQREHPGGPGKPCAICGLGFHFHRHFPLSVHIPADCLTRSPRGLGLQSHSLQPGQGGRTGDLRGLGKLPKPTLGSALPSPWALETPTSYPHPGAPLQASRPDFLRQLPVPPNPQSYLPRRPHAYPQLSPGGPFPVEQGRGAWRVRPTGSNRSPAPF